ncbi:reducing polyketide synthase FUB1 [Hirsutella rhossiliensis]|uniref:Reducing polyketide synthase FUB1 n=1 Tax=Hirsutella rhossiliensis TaxID=111463 RepID=A0A9P8MXD2_9HYPO|nr:reducing polyketide synthase FUB1 [Hirsutella rhossiliensis]KAH0962737.1 reducing polyketide synthase FUB1 [Hirsutella rhossiliensis]
MPAEAIAMDPEQRLLLELTYEALEDAGVPVEAIAASSAACFISNFTHNYKFQTFRDLSHMPQYTVTGMARAMLSNRISWFYNLRGPSVTLDTACSSSLVALHLTCDTIRSKSNDTTCALVGGSSLILGPEYMSMLSALHLLSPDSRCFSFDSRANGYACGEGVGMLVIKRAKDAILDGDTIRAVIRATGSNQDGKTPGITVPSVEAQSSLMQRTYTTFGLDPALTALFELHGTGTPVGDPIEIEATSLALGSAARTGSPLFYGSVKTNIGRLEGSAGIAGVIKCVLAMESGLIFPNLILETLNPRLRLHEWNMSVPRSLIAWPPGPVRRCSINLFGIGGSNAYAVLDDAEGYLQQHGLVSTQCGSAETGSFRLYVVSAPEKAAVQRDCASLADRLAGGKEAPLADLAFTLGVRRSLFPWRHTMAASSIEDLIRQCMQPNIQPGAQWYAMSRELLEHDVFRESVESSSAILKELGATWDA